MMLSWSLPTSSVMLINDLFRVVLVLVVGQFVIRERALVSSTSERHQGVGGFTTAAAAESTTEPRSRDTLVPTPFTAGNVLLAHFFHSPTAHALSTGSCGGSGDDTVLTRRRLRRRPLEGLPQLAREELPAPEAVALAVVVVPDGDPGPQPRLLVTLVVLRDDEAGGRVGQLRHQLTDLNWRPLGGHAWDEKKKETVRGRTNEEKKIARTRVRGGGTKRRGERGGAGGELAAAVIPFCQ